MKRLFAFCFSFLTSSAAAGGRRYESLQPKRALATLVFGGVLVLSGQPALAQHAGDIWVGRTSAAPQRIKLDTWRGFDPAATALVLPPTEPGGLFDGWSDNEPGFDRVTTPLVDEDVHPLVSGVNIWIRVEAMNPALIALVPPSFYILEMPGDVAELGGHQIHRHPLWLIDAEDPAFDPGHCQWEATFVLEDRGTTGYQDSEPFTLRFRIHPVIPGDFDCDGDVDADDLGTFLGCFTGPAIPYDPQNLPSGCTLAPDSEGIIPADFNRDGTVDQTDFAFIQRCLSGEDIPGDPNCAG